MVVCIPEAVTTKEVKAVLLTITISMAMMTEKWRLYTVKYMYTTFKKGSITGIGKRMTWNYGGIT